ncbi:hypothetical protein B0T25DRAFT_80516 [Lasiosphaeria hispida]|uniref:Uncharacterized protein n=1 Tax=Lasiosphaeria hispida TaxID=260671 RepID=A0AAJ0HPA3_9PEZI|nr:hypothetical protein B0T25DRAFT_80516 [Lasiosphaeria hispida]
MRQSREQDNRGSSHTPEFEMDQELFMPHRPRALRPRTAVTMTNTRKMGQGRAQNRPTSGILVLAEPRKITKPLALALAFVWRHRLNPTKQRRILSCGWNNKVIAEGQNITNSRVQDPGSIFTPAGWQGVLSPSSDVADCICATTPLPAIRNCLLCCSRSAKRKPTSLPKLAPSLTKTDWYPYLRPAARPDPTTFDLVLRSPIHPTSMP